MIEFTYSKVAELNGLTYDTVESDVRFIRKEIKKFVKGARFKVRELSYYQYFRSEVKRTNSRKLALEALKAAYDQDMAESSIYYEAN